MTWSTPYEWLIDKASQWTHDELIQELIVLACALDADIIQDLYQSEMSSDGYFDDDVVHCPRCDEDVKADGPNTTSMGDHGMCVECHRAWQLGQATKDWDDE